MSKTEPMAAREAFAACMGIVGAAVGVAVMAFHPSGHQMREAADRSAVLLLNRLVHTAAIVAVLLQTCGGIALVRRLRATDVGLAHLAFVAQCTAAVAATIAGMCSGFVMPAFLVDPSAGDAARVGADVVWAVNQAFAKLFAIAGGTAIALWSVAGWRRRLPTATCGVGVVVGAVAIALVGADRLPMNVHGMGAVVLGQAIWWVLVGSAMLRRRA